MATALKLRSDIKKLKKALETKGISDSVKAKLKTQLNKAEAELDSIQAGKKPKQSSVKGTKTALSSLQKLIKGKRYSVYQGSNVDLKKDAGEGALPTGRRVSKGLKSNQFGKKGSNKGNVYYEYRANRLDVKQPKAKQKYPKLEAGGFMAEGGEADKVDMSGFRKNIMGTLSFNMKMPKMKKSQDFIVYPASEKSDYIVIQSDTRFGKIEMSTGRGLMSQSHANGAYSHHFMLDKKVKFQLTQSQLEELKQQLSKTAGSSVGTRGVISDNSYADKFASGGYMAEGGKVGKMYLKKGDIVYVFQSAFDKNGKLQKGVDSKYVVGNEKEHNLQKWAKVEVIEEISDEIGWERYRGKKIEGEFNFYDKKAKNGDIVAFLQSSSSKYNNKPISMGYTEEERFKADGGMMAKGGVMKKGAMGGLKIKNWYIKNYPTDELGEEINDTITFKGYWGLTNQGNDPYEVLGVGDSVVRERVEEKLSEMVELEKGGYMADGGKIDVSILEVLNGENKGKTLNGIAEGLGLSDYRYNKYASESEMKKLKNKLEKHISQGHVKEGGVGYVITTKGSNYLDSISYGDRMASGGYMAKGGEIKAGDYVIVDNPHWKASMGVEKAVRRKVKMVADDNVFFHDGSNSSMKYVKKLASGGYMAKGGELNLKVRKMAQEYGLTHKDLGKDYAKTMAQAAVESLTDANYHAAARKLVSILENKPEWAADPYKQGNVPDFNSPDYKKWRDSSVYSSEYWDADDNTSEFARKVATEAGWDGYEIANAYQYVVRTDSGQHKLAENISKAMQEEMKYGGYMAEGGIISKTHKLG